MTDLGNGQVVYTNDVSILDRDIINSVYASAYRRATLLGSFDSDGILDFLVDNNLWNLEQQEELDNISKRIEDTKAQLYSSYLTFRNLDIIRDNLKALRKKRATLYELRHKYDAWTSEEMAQQVTLDYMLWRNTFYEGGNKLFNCKMEEVDISLIEALRQSYLDNYVGDAEIRMLAHDDNWCSIHSVQEFLHFPYITELQKSLLAWSKFYDNVRESMDCPPKEVIEDDDLLDGWAILQQRKIEKDRTNSQTEKVVGGRHGNADEIFVVVENKDAVKRINDLNSDYGKMVQRQKLGLAIKQGAVREEDMPESKRKIRDQAFNEAKRHG